LAQCTVGSPLSSGAALGLAFGIIGAVIIGFVVLGIWLWWSNRHAEKKNTSHPHPVLRFVKFFFQYLFIELLSIPFFVTGVLSMTNNGIEGTGVGIAFFVFSSLKYLIAIFVILMENVKLYNLNPIDQEKQIKYRYQSIGQKVYLPPGWITMLEGGIFIPLLIVEGMISNFEIRQCDIGDLFPYDMVVTVVIDAVFYVKLFLSFTLEIYRPRPYQIPMVIYAMLQPFVTLCYTFLFVVYQLARDQGFNLSGLSIVMMVIALVHNTVASFSSMLLQGIEFRCRALFGSDLRIKLVNVYLNWFSGAWYYIILNVIAYGFCFAMYVIVYVIAADVLVYTNPDPGISALVYVVAIMTLIINTWLLLNYFYAVLKRAGSQWGSRFGCSRNPLRMFRFTAKCSSWIPEVAFNNSSYSTALNRVIRECGAGWTFTFDMRRAGI